jgi:hypothetical protein
MQLIKLSFSEIVWDFGNWDKLGWLVRWGVGSQM